MPANLTAGWDIVVQYAGESWSLPEAHACLQECLGDQFIASKWKESLDTVLGAEEDTSATLAALATLRNKWAPDAPLESPDALSESPDECHDIENELLNLVTQLKDRRCIFGQPCTLDEILDPEEEQEIGENTHAFEGEDAEIVGMVQQEMGPVRGNTEEIDSDDEAEVVPLPLKEMIKMCRILEENSMVVCTEGALELIKALRQYWTHLQRMSREGKKQMMLDDFFHF
jgi:hypothetical protein